ncbi:HotDog domain-containing protein [Gymnopilus junonius]|uniref:HotDog domain-containing protein n=1 Tax=Gymnopilus junonius TaxID=109634 RepID=A0A9P5N909_GYMJU|nr:HotDog domain-containing protein [Gymnopilus junonius]
MTRASAADSTVDISRIAGNASDDIKRFLGIILTSPRKERSPAFAESIQRRLKVTEVSINKKAEEERKTEARVVLELEVSEDMLNGGGNIHGGCSAFLVDTCSTLALIALGMANTGEFSPSVSQSLNIVYHSPAQLGDKLRLVNTTLTLGARAHSARTEIWTITHHRLVVSGTHVKMAPSTPKSNL